MKLYYKFLITVLVFLPSAGFGQDDYKEKYEKGKDYFNQGKYTVAMEILKPITVESEGNKFVPYAQYFYSLSAFKASLFPAAHTMVTVLINNYPQWEEIDEAYYLAGALAFEQKRYRQALSILEGRKKELKDDIEKMKLFYSEKINPIDTLINIQKDFPSDAVLAKALVKKLSGSFMTEKQRMLLEYLIQEYRLDKKDFVNAGKESVKKPAYNVAVIFPFMTKETNPALIKNNQYVNDLYQGMRMAVDSLKKAGVTINLYAYDSEREESKLGEILNLPEMKGMDMVIGPLYPFNYTLVNDFANKNQILVVNPLSNNSSLVEGNPFVYLFQPSLKAFAGQAAQYAKKNFPIDEKVKHVLIFQSPTSKDSLASMYFKDSITSKGFEIKSQMVVTKENMNDAKKLLDSMKLLTVSHIFISSSDQILAANIISAMEISKKRTPLIVSPEWLQFSLLTYDQYERNEVHVLLPEFIDYSGTEIYAFRKSYYSRTNLLPTTQVFQGYELLKYFGGALGKYGNYFVSGVQKEGFTSGSIFQGYNFSSGNSNAFVPVVRFYENNLKVMNNPLFPPVLKEKE